MSDYDPYAPRQTVASKKKAGPRKAKVERELTGGADDPAPSDTGANVAGEQLRAFVDRIESIQAEKAELNDDEKAVYAEVKAMGFDAKVVRRIIAIRKQDPNERAEFEAVLDTYLHALGMQMTLPGVE